LIQVLAVVQFKHGVTHFSHLSPDLSL